MNHNAGNTFAVYGLEILKHAVLLLLYQTASETLSVKEIRERLGLHHKSLGTNLIRDVLEFLKEEETVEDEDWGLIGHWRITEKGVSVIEG